MMTRRALIALLTMVLLTVAMIEGGLRLVDPWGALRYFADQGALYNTFVTDERRGYHPQPGSYRFSNWQAIVLPDGARRVPDSNPNGCTVVFLGDSVTFGFGVSDSETWVNLLARELRIHATNAGVYSYNTERVRDSLNAYPGAAVYIYLLIDNDGDPDPNWQQRSSGHLAIRDYWYAAKSPSFAPPPHTPGFAAALAEMKWRSTIIAFNTGHLSNTVGATLIPPYTRTLSHADSHPNAEGNREIAAALLPVVRAAVDRACPVL